jgi:hypothetical protein
LVYVLSFQKNELYFQSLLVRDRLHPRSPQHSPFLGGGSEAPPHPQHPLGTRLISADEAPRRRAQGLHPWDLPHAGVVDGPEQEEHAAPHHRPDVAIADPLGHDPAGRWRLHGEDGPDQPEGPGENGSVCFALRTEAPVSPLVARGLGGLHVGPVPPGAPSRGDPRAQHDDPVSTGAATVTFSSVVCIFDAVQSSAKLSLERGLSGLVASRKRF